MVGIRIIGSTDLEKMINLDTNFLLSFMLVNIII